MDYRGKLQSIRALLLAEWDPIGVRDEAAIQDEYDQYLPAILGLLERRAPIAEVAGYLTGVATTEMGLVDVEERDRAVAESLLRLPLA